LISIGAAGLFYIVASTLPSIMRCSRAIIYSAVLCFPPILNFFTGPISNVDTNNFCNLYNWQLQVFARELISCMALRTAMGPTMNISRKETAQKKVH
jgi:hypothetical protein